MEYSVEFIGETVPDLRRQAQLRLPEITANRNYTSLEHLRQPGRAGSHRFHRGPQSLPALTFVGRPDQYIDLRPRLFQQTFHEERSNETGSTREQHIVQDRYLRKQCRRGRRKDELPVAAHHRLFRGALLLRKAAREFRSTTSASSGACSSCSASRNK